MLDRAGPLDLSERRMDDEKLLAGNDARELDRHALAVLAAAARYGDQRAELDQFAALARDDDVDRLAA